MKAQHFAVRPIRNALYKSTPLLLTCLLAFLPGTGRAQQATILAFDKCPVTGNDPPPLEAASNIFALLLPQLITSGVDMAATALSEAAKAKTKVTLFDGEPFASYKLQSDADLARGAVNCLVLVAEGTVGNKVPLWLGGPDVPQWITQEPAFYMELEIRPQGDSLDSILAPVLLFVSKEFQIKGNSRKEVRGYAVAMSLKASYGSDAYGAAAFAFDGVKALQVYGERNVEGRELLYNWPRPVAIPRLPANDDLKQALGTQATRIATIKELNGILKAAEEAPKAPPRRGEVEDTTEYRDALKGLCAAIGTANEKWKPAIKEDKCPYAVTVERWNVRKVEADRQLVLATEWAQAFFKSEHCKDKDATGKRCKYPEPKESMVGMTTVTASVTETAEATKFVQLVASAFGAKKAEISTELNDKLNPWRIKELTEAKASAEQAASDAFQVALLKVSELEAKLDEAGEKSASEKITLRIQLMEAKIAANKAALAAGRAAPYPSY